MPSFRSIASLLAMAIKRHRGGDLLPPPISKLGADLLVQILIRVPEPRSMFRCKSVCKLWNSVISDPYFKRRFVCHHQSRTGCEGEPDLLPSNDPQSVLSFIPVPDELKRHFMVMDCFKDLLLCGFAEVWAGNEPARSYIVCNPFTKQWIALPLAPRRISVDGKVVARLVCQPVVSCYLNDDGGGEEIIYSEYRFRVACLYDTYGGETKMDLFCSESGEWESEALVLQKRLRCDDGISLDGNLYWANNQWQIVECDPSHLHTKPPTAFSALPLLRGNVRHSSFSTSQGGLYIVQFEEEEGNALGVWIREKENCRPRPKWRRLYQVSLKTLMAKYKLEGFWLDAVLGLHPGKPEVVFLRFGKPGWRMYSIFSCNLSKGELEEEPGLCRSRDSPYWKVFQPSFCCWPTPIPRYEELRCNYDGSFACLLQNGGPEEDWQPRKNKRIKITADQVSSEEAAYGRGRTNRSKSRLKLTVTEDTIIVQSRKRRAMTKKENVSEK